MLSVREGTKGCTVTVPEKSGFVPVPFAQNVRDELRILPGYVGVLAAQPGMKQQTFLAYPLSVRRLMPQECERLQGFPRGHTAIPYRGKPSSDSSRYKVIGNSMPVPVMHWIGKRIAEVSREQD